MAKIIDPDNLTSRLSTDTDTGQDITYNVTTKRIDIRDDASGGTNIDLNDGVTLQAVYSKAVEDWKNNENLRAFEFPFEAIGIGEIYDLIDGWNWEDSASRMLLKDGGFSVRASAGANPTEEWMCVPSLGDIEVPASHTPYWQQVSGGATTDANQAGVLNQVIQIWSDPNADGNPADGFDYRSSGSAFFTAFLREWEHVYDEYNLPVAQGLPELTYRVYKIPLANRPDSSLAAWPTENTVDTTAPYTGMSVKWLKGSGFAAWANSTVYPAESVVSDGGRWYYTVAGGTSSGTGVGDDVGVTWVAYDGERQIGANYYAYNIIVTGNNGTKDEIYAFVQRQLRKTTDINSGATGQEDTSTKIGKVTPLMMTNTLATLTTLTGVYLDGLAAGDKNNVEFTDVGGVKRTFPALATLTLTFSPTLQGDANAWYHVFFTNDDPPGADAGNDYGTAGAITVQNDTPADMKGLVNGQPQIQLSYEFDTNVQRGPGSAGSAVPLTAVAGGQNINGAAYVRAAGTMATAAAGLTLGLTAPQDRAYKT